MIRMFEFEKGCYRLVASLLASDDLEKTRNMEVKLLRTKNGTIHIVDLARELSVRAYCGKVISLREIQWTGKTRLKNLALSLILRESAFCRSCIVFFLWDIVKPIYDYHNWLIPDAKVLTNLSECGILIDEKNLRR